ncbi:MAG: type II secretion system protein [Candidatus Paceibacterota bacterium]|jgi:prepilin-type N-terminal cleavage/methylation domain-containing protein
MIKNINNKKLGFSLIEILVVMGIVVLIGGSVATFQRDVIVHNSMIQSGAIAEDGVRNTLRQVIGELRSASPAQTGAYLLSAVATNTITFYSDIDSDGLRERVRYFLSGTDFKKGIVKPTGQPYIYNIANEQIRTVSPNVINATTSIFSYYDTNYNGSSSALSLPIDIAKVRLIKINVGIDPNPGRPLQAMWVSSQVMIRNLKDNF